MHNQTVAPPTHPTWVKLVSGAIQPEFHCLALKLMMIRIRIAYDRNAKDAPALVKEVRDFFVSNLRFALKDHANLFPEFGA